MKQSTSEFSALSGLLPTTKNPVHPRPCWGNHTNALLKPHRGRLHGHPVMSWFAAWREPPEMPRLRALSLEAKQSRQLGEADKPGRLLCRSRKTQLLRRETDNTLSA